MGAIPAPLPSYPAQVDKIAYGVIHNSDDAGNCNYLCGVEVSEFPTDPREFTRLRISPQTYAVFLHTDHISTVGATCSAIWNEGLPDSGYKAADGPWFERYGEEFSGRTGLGGLEIGFQLCPDFPGAEAPQHIYLALLAFTTSCVRISIHRSRLADRQLRPINL